MYYLLNNNRVIDTNDKTFKSNYFERSALTFYSIETPDEYHTHIGLCDIYTNHTYEFSSRDIKKQSDNIFDLIEVGDLIKHNQYHDKEKFEKVLKENTWFGARGFETNDFYSIDECNIIAIYKPNTNGDYIKVWEKESE